MKAENFIESPNADLVTVLQLAGYFGIDRSGCRKWLIREGFKTRRIRLEETGNQLSAALSRQEAQQAIARRKSQGFKVKS